MSALLSIVNLWFVQTVLSIDNALVLTVILAQLPKQKRTQAAIVGFAAAVVFRLVAIGAAEFIIAHALAQVAGALFLIYITCEHFGSDAEKSDDNAAKQSKTRSFWSAIVSLVIADLTFSIDNIVAAVAFTSSPWVIWPATILSMAVTFACLKPLFAVLEKHPILESAAFALIGLVGIQMLTRLAFGFHVSEVSMFFVTVGLLGAALLYERLPKVRTIVQPIVFPLRAVARVLHWFFSTIVQIAVQAVNLVWKALSRIFGGR